MDNKDNLTAFGPKLFKDTSTKNNFFEKSYLKKKSVTVYFVLHLTVKSVLSIYFNSYCTQAIKLLRKNS